MTPAKTATQIDRPERFHVEVSDPAEMHEFPERAYGAKVRLCNRDGVRGDRPSLIHMRTDVGPFAIEEVQLRGDIEASTDPINKVVGVWVTAGRAEGHSDGIAGSATPGEVTMVAQPDVLNYTHTQDVCQISVLMDPSVVASVATGTPASKASLPIRFMSLQPVNAASAQRCKDTLHGCSILNASTTRSLRCTTSSDRRRRRNTGPGRMFRCRCIRRAMSNDRSLGT